MWADKSEITAWDRKYRLRFMNSISGYKAVHLIGSANKKGEENVAIFNSIVHLGANPAHIGFMMRPLTIERNTYQNIKETGYFTINHVHHDFVEKAHYTSVKFAPGVSEFEECGLNPEKHKGFPAPYVKESKVKIGLKFVDEHFVQANGTILMVGEVVKVYVDEACIKLDGQLDLEKAEDVCITGLNQYSIPRKYKHLPYARMEELPDFKGKDKPDNVAFDTNSGKYNAHLLPYASNIGAPKIAPTQVSTWKNTSIISYNQSLDNKVQKLREKYEDLLTEFGVNDRIYRAKMSFDPIVGKEYHLYINNQGEEFLSLIEPGQWNMEYLGTYALNHEKVWEQLNK